MALLLMLVTILSACSKSGTVSKNNTSPSASGDGASSDAASKDPVTLRISEWGSPDEVAAYKVAIKKFEAKFPNVKVDLQHIATDYDTKLTTMVAGNDVPDIAMMESGTIAFPLAEQGKFYNLQEFMDSDPDISIDKLVPNIMYSLEPGNVIGIGPGPESFGLFITKISLRKRGFHLRLLKPRKHGHGMNL